MDLPVTFEEAFNGAEKHVTLRVPGQGREGEAHGEGSGRRRGRRARALQGPRPARARMAARRGDLLVVTRIQPHAYYAREGADVVLSLPVTFAEAALGAAIVVPAPDGTKVRVKVPAGTQNGTVLTVRGKGAPRVKGGGTGRPAHQDRGHRAHRPERSAAPGARGLPSGIARAGAPLVNSRRPTAALGCRAARPVGAIGHEVHRPSRPCR